MITFTRVANALPGALMVIAAWVMFGTEVSAQEKQKVSWKTTTDYNKYTKRHVIEVGDITPS